jgi:hypothetical protein
LTLVAMTGAGNVVECEFCLLRLGVIMPASRALSTDACDVLSPGPAVCEVKLRELTEDEDRLRRAGTGNSVGAGASSKTAACEEEAEEAFDTTDAVCALSWESSRWRRFT